MTAGNVTAVADPFNRSATYLYDADSRLSSTTDRMGRRRDFTYDDDGRQLTDTWYAYDGVTVLGRVVNVYDDDGNRTSASIWTTQTAATYTYSYAYDNMDRVTSQTGPFGATLTFTLDEAGNQVVVADNIGGGSKTTSVFDGANRLLARKIDSQVQAGFLYYPDGTVQELDRYTFSNGMAMKASYATYSYDLGARVTRIAQGLGNGMNGPFATYTYSYDAGNRLTAETYNTTSTTYAYDNADQLTSAGPKSYGYDAAGNRNTGGFTPGPTGDQLQTDGTWNYTYDNEGNRAKKTKGTNAETWTYGYDNLNRLIWVEQRATDGGTLLQHVDYAYDALGSRIQKSVTANNVTTVSRFVVLNQSVYADLDGSNAVTARYLRGAGDQLIANATNLRWYLTDRENSVRGLVAAGIWIDHMNYDAYGNLINYTGSYADRWRYTGREAEVESGLQYNRARYLDPIVASWINRDPIGFAGGDPNLYRYVSNSPTNGTDPSGNFITLITGAIGAVVGGAIGGVSSYIQSGGDWSSTWQGAGKGALLGGVAGLTGGLASGAVMAGMGATAAGASVATVAGATLVSGAVGGAVGNATSQLVSMQVGWQTDFSLSQVAGSAAGGLLGGGLSLGIGKLLSVPLVGGSCNPTAGQAVRAFASNVTSGTLGGAAGDAVFQAMDIAANRQQGWDWGRTAVSAAAAAGSSVGSYLAMRVCFAAGTPLLTPGGSKAIEKFHVGDLILSRSEFDPHGPLEVKRVEEVFVRTGSIINLHVGAEVIKTTAEHPFWVLNKGWHRAGGLKIGDVLLSHDGQWVAVEDLLDTGEYETVYNVRVVDFHTYFVGSEEWGFSVWAHNAACVYDARTNNYRDTETGQFVSAGKLPWPSAGGFATSRTGFLRRGTIIDRYGSPSGGVAGRPGDSVSQRGLPPGSEGRPYTKYEVVQTIRGVEIGTAAPVPAFDAAGGGRQYGFGGRSLQDFVDGGFLRAIR